jgi:AraC family transcriptional regulator
VFEAHLDCPPGIPALAQVTGLSGRQFLRAFKATFGVSLHQFVLQRRIERAKELLAAGGQSLTGLALDLGFASHAHFTTAFRARTGTTPSAFRCTPTGGVHLIQGSINAR